MTRNMHLAMVFVPPGLHPAGWRLPQAAPHGESAGYAQYIRAAQAAERGKFDFMFFQDGAEGAEAVRPDFGTPYRPRLEPFELLPSLAMATSRIGLVATASTNFNHPYRIARHFATLDHLSGGRAGWNLVASEIANEPANFAADGGPQTDDRYSRAGEFYDVCCGLWDSWDEGALIRDKDSGQYYDPAKVHALNHTGRFFKVRGPLSVERCPQGRPVIAAADSSPAGRALAARCADVVFTAQRTLDAAQAFYHDMKGRLAAHGRGETDLKIMPGLMPIVADTDAEAGDLYRQLQAGLPDDAARAAFEEAGPLVMQGSPQTLADLMQQWVEAGAADGFTILVPFYPGGLDAFVDRVIPELQRRGLFRNDYEGAMLRDHLRLPFPVSRYATA
jgi:FMN-dependent oxidoreductase (nitrilotriacetate monooxygenase family)